MSVGDSREPCLKKTSVRSKSDVTGHCRRTDYRETARRKSSLFIKTKIKEAFSPQQPQTSKYINRRVKTICKQKKASEY